MTDRPSRFQLLFRLIGHWRLILAGLLSVAAAAFVWTRPVPPLWEHVPAVADTYINVIGITENGQVVSIDRPPGEVVTSQLRVRDAGTGVLLSDHLIPDHQYYDIHVSGSSFRNGQLSGDGEWAILTSGGMGCAHVISLKTGELRYPPLIGVYGVNSCSPDGSFAVLEAYGISTDAEGRIPQVFDLQSGQFLWKCDEETQFSPDSQQLLGYRYEDDQLKVTIHSLPEGTILLSEDVPPVLRGIRPQIHYWSGERVYVIYPYDVPESEIPSRLCWSYDTQSGHLTGARQEPEIGGGQDGESKFALSMFQGKFRGMKRIDFPAEHLTLYARILDSLNAYGIDTPNIQTRFYSWQPLDLKEARPFGAEIQGLDHDFKLSSDGTWLADGGDQLRVWRLPAERSWGRWFWTFLAGALPWSVFWIRQRKKQAVPA